MPFKVWTPSSRFVVASHTSIGSRTVACIGEYNTYRFTIVLPWPYRLGVGSTVVTTVRALGNTYAVSDMRSMYQMVSSFADTLVFNHGRLDVVFNTLGFSGYTTSHVVGAYSSITTLIQSRDYWIAGQPGLFNTLSAYQPGVTSLNNHLSAQFSGHYVIPPSFLITDFTDSAAPQFLNDSGMSKFATAIRSAMLTVPLGP